MQRCLNQITIGRRPPQDTAELSRQLAAARAGGWTAMELWLRHWDAVFEREGSGARRLLQDAGITATGGCAHPGLFFSTGETLRRFQDELRRRLEQCQALGAPHLVITPGTPGEDLPERLDAAALALAAANLRAAAALAAPFGVRLGIEFLKGARMVNNLYTALALAGDVAHPNVGVVLDTFHFYAGPSKLEDLDALGSDPARLSFVHVNDVPFDAPREGWTDAARVLPGEGAFPLGTIFQRLAAAGYDGPVSLELFNDAFAARWAESPEAAASAAYASVAALPAAAPAGA
jgi:2-keto-myo-inositol isomerase